MDQSNPQSVRVAPCARAGRGLKPLDPELDPASVSVAPCARAGRGLKHAERLRAEAQGASCSLRARRERIETWSASTACCLRGLLLPARAQGED